MFRFKGLFCAIGKYFRKYNASIIISSIAISYLYNKYTFKTYLKSRFDENTFEIIKFQEKDIIPYVIVGNGTAAYYSAISILSNDPKAKILIISDNKFLPFSFDTKNQNAFFYSHLKDSLASSDEIELKYSFPHFDNAVPFSDLFSNPDSQGVSYYINTNITSIDSNKKTLILELNEEIKYDKLIIANEMCQKPHPVISKLNSDKIITISNVDDYSQLLKKISEKIESATIVGTSTHAYSLAYSLHKIYPKLKIYLIKEENNFIDSLPVYLEDKIAHFFEKNKINIIKENVVDTNLMNNKLVIECNENKIETDLAVVFNKKYFDNQFLKGNKCFGDECPELNKELTKYSIGLNISDNIPIEAKSRSLFISGDNSYYESGFRSNLDPIGFEYSHITAKIAGKLASSGILEHSSYLPFRIFNIANNLRLHFVGDCSQALETTSVWKKNSLYNIKSPGLVLYHKEGMVVGILLWNIPNKLDLADEVITSKTSIVDPIEIAKWFLPKSDEKLEQINSSMIKTE